MLARIFSRSSCWGGTRFLRSSSSADMRLSKAPASLVEHLDGVHALFIQIVQAAELLMCRTDLGIYWTSPWLRSQFGFPAASAPRWRRAYQTPFGFPAERLARRIRACWTRCTRALGSRAKALRLTGLQRCKGRPQFPQSTRPAKGFMRLPVFAGG